MLRSSRVWESLPLILFLPPPRYHPIDNMATMAAAIAASLPTVQAAPVPVAPTQESLPPSWNKSVDAEAEIPVTTVQIDGLVCLGVYRGEDWVTER